MKIAFNPSTVAALITPPNNKDITFDLRGRNIFARGVKFCGTDTWRDIKINNVSIDSNILDLQNGDNTTLTNINGVVTINSTWRPVVDNLTSDSTTSSLSANQGRVLVGLINTLSTNISNQYALRDGSNATGRWRGGLACLDVRDTNYTPHDLNMGLELHFFSNTANNLKDGGDFNGVFSFRQWASGSNWTRGKAHQLSFTDNGNIWHRTSSGDDSWGTWKKLAYFTDIPSSLKNPYALTISLNGTSQGPYDGSAAKNINITPSSIGAATSGHNHDGRYVYNYGGTANVNGQALNQNALFMSTTSGITKDWWHILQAARNDEYRWNSQIAFPTQNRNGMYYRSGLNDNTAWGSWIKLLDVNNYSSTLDSRYYTESEVNSLLDAKLNRQNLSYGTWNPRGYNLAADYYYNGGDLSISESGSQIHVTVDGYFWQNKGQHRVLDTSASCNKNWSYSGQSGQPSWLWGTNDGTNCYVWNPSNFSVAKSEYSRNLLGRSTSGSDYGAISGNLVFAEWNTMNDSRWYLKATGYECRVAYANSAGNADTVDGYHATDGRTFTGNINWSDNWNDTWSDGTNKHPWYGFDHRYPNTGAYSTTLTDYYGMTIKTANTLRLDFGTLLLNSGNVGIGTTSPAYKLDVNGQMRASGFHHASHNNDDAVLLAGGSYKTLRDLTNNYYWAYDNKYIKQPICLEFVTFVSYRLTYSIWSSPTYTNEAGNITRLTIPNLTVPYKYEVYALVISQSNPNTYATIMNTTPLQVKITHRESSSGYFAVMIWAIPS